MPPLEPPNRVQWNIRIKSYDKEVQTRRQIHKEHQKQNKLRPSNDIVGLASVRDNMNRLWLKKLMSSYSGNDNRSRLRNGTMGLVTSYFHNGSLQSTNHNSQYHQWKFQHPHHIIKVKSTPSWRSRAKTDLGIHKFQTFLLIAIYYKQKLHPVLQLKG
jgi:hypothetical protein